MKQFVIIVMIVLGTVTLIAQTPNMKILDSEYYIKYKENDEGEMIKYKNFVTFTVTNTGDSPKYPQLYNIAVSSDTILDLDEDALIWVKQEYLNNSDTTKHTVRIQNLFDAQFDYVNYILITIYDISSHQSDTMIIDIRDIEIGNNIIEHDKRIYPNPIIDAFHTTFNYDNYIIYDLTGKKINNTIPELIPGMYIILFIRYNAIIYKQKIIIQK